MTTSRSLLLAALLATAGCNSQPVPASEPETPAANSDQAAQAEPDAIPAPSDVAAPPADAERTESGLASKVLQPGTGTRHPIATDEVKVNYTGWTTDGAMFDSSVRRGQPATFPLNRVIAGWTEGVQLMVEGEKRRFWIPENLAYQGRPGSPQGMLVFDVELLEITTQPPPPTPEDVAAPPADARRTRSGLAYKVLTPGTGSEHPADGDRVEIHVTGWTADGNMFNSTVTRGRSITQPLERLMPGWIEALKLMTTGEKMRLWVPESLAYQGRPGAPAGTLCFELELISIIHPVPAPADVAAAPADAERTESGLASKVLTPGTGTEHPAATSQVTVQYSGWTTDGRMFDSSVMRGQPATFRLNQVIPGWTEGVQLMVVGEKRRFWIPESLAYAGRPGAPQGMLVFDVELLGIE